MAVVPCGSTWVARWGGQPQLTIRASARNKLSVPSHNLSSKTRALASPSSAMFASLPALYKTRVYNKSSHHRGARLVVRANSDFYAVLGVSKNANKSEIKSGYRKLARNYHPDVNKQVICTFRF